MAIKTRILCITLVILSILVSLPSFKDGSLWWDEAVYLGLAENVQERGEYSIDATAKVVDDFRPPLFPLLIVSSQQLFGQTELIARLVNPFITLLVALSLFYTGKKMHNETIGFLAAVFTITNSQYVFWNSKILSEPLAILVTTWTLFSAYQVFGKNESKYYLALFPLLALAFLTRYPLGSLGIATLLFAIVMKKERIFGELRNTHAWTGIALFLAILAPWFVYNHKTYGNIFGSVLTNFAVVQQYNDSALIYITRFLPNLQLLGIITCLALVYAIITREKRALLSSIFIITCFGIFAFVLGQKDFRYTVVTLPAMALLSAALIQKIDDFLEMNTIFSFLLAALIVSLSFPTGYQMAILSKEVGESPQQAAQYISENIDNQSSIMTKHYPLFAYITKRHVVDFPESPREIDPFIERYNVSYVVIDTIENYPLWAREHFQNNDAFKIDRVFTDERHNATVYVPVD